MAEQRGSLSRRTFIGAALSMPAAAVAAGCGGSGEGPAARTTAAATGSDATATVAATWRDVRALFDLDPEIAHLSAYILAPHSRPVRQAIERHRRGLDRAPQQYFHRTQWRAEQRLADRAAAHLGTDADLVALTDSTTMGLGVVMGGMRFAAGDEILMTAHEHFVASEAARVAARRTGAVVRRVELYPPRAPEQATTQGIVSAIERGIGARTRVVLVTWVHSANGVKLPLREIADVVERANRGRGEEQRALLVVDAAHGFGAGPTRVGQLGADALVAGCHKWLMGPRGTGIAWARPEVWRRMTPIVPTFDARPFAAWTEGRTNPAPPGPTFTPGGYHAFEQRWALDEALALHARIGAARIARRVEQLGDRLRDGLAGAPGVRVHAPREARLRSGVVSFSVDGLGPEAVVERLIDRHGVSATVAPYPVALARLGTTWINTDEEIEAAIRAVRRLA